MAAFSSGGTAARLKAKNSAMAAAMKQAGVDRHTANCPLCHRRVSVNREARQAITSGMYQHIISCKGRRPR